MWKSRNGAESKSNPLNIPDTIDPGSRWYGVLTIPCSFGSAGVSFFNEINLSVGKLRGNSVMNYDKLPTIHV